ncbi:MAG: hypothetical protein OEX19_00400 [Gammaproteobacteria bacterium]|nr:hypothetical protein [Gammaproteobacteria bacterium]
MIKFLLIPVVIFAAAGAQILMKYAINLVLLDRLPLFNLFKAWHIYASVSLYVLAFAATIYLFSVFELSFISPLLVAGVMLLIFIAGIYWGETITAMRISGGLLLVTATLLLAYSR